MKNSFMSSFREYYVSRHQPESLRPIAEAYWRVLLVCTLVSAIGVMLFGLWEFRSVQEKIMASQVSTVPKKSVLDRAQLDLVLVRFSERKANFEMMKTATGTAADPSR